MIATAAVRAAARAGVGRAYRNPRMPRPAATPPLLTDLARRAMQRFPSNIGARLCPAPRSAVLDHQGSPTRLPALVRRRAPPTPSAQPERTAVASPGQAWSQTADVRTTSASPTRLVERGRPAFAVVRPRTTARICVTLVAIVPWTRIAAQADIALPQWRPATQQTTKPWSRAGTMAVRTPTIAIRHRISASTIRTALRSTRGQPPRPP